MIKFTKMQGLGNDYVYIDCTKKEQIKDISSFTRFVSDRHFGIGSDGLILICNSNVADFKMRMFNYDGTEAEMCGNGIRCVGKFVFDKVLTQKEEITVETIAGIKKLQFTIKDNKVELVKVDMGEPILEAKEIPVIYDLGNNLTIKALDKEFAFTCVSMGNPHAVTVVQNVADFNIEKYGPILENDKHFPKRANIEFIEIIDKKRIKMRVWERGAGETLACGTGACATLVASVLNKYIEKKADIELIGGVLNIEWGEDNHVYMTGPAVTVFEGSIESEYGK